MAEIRKERQTRIGREQVIWFPTAPERHLSQDKILSPSEMMKRILNENGEGEYLWLSESRNSALKFQEVLPTRTVPMSEESVARLEMCVYNCSTGKTEAGEPLR